MVVTITVGIIIVLQMVVTITTRVITVHRVMNGQLLVEIKGRIELCWELLDQYLRHQAAQIRSLELLLPPGILF